MFEKALPASAPCILFWRMTSLDNVPISLDGSKQQQFNQWSDGHENGAKMTATIHLLTLMPSAIFQGSEADIVLVSFVRANVHGGGRGWSSGGDAATAVAPSSRGRIGFVRDYRRLNVALTRAKHTLILFAHTQTLLAAADGGGGLRRLVEDAQRRGAVLGEHELEHKLRTQLAGK
jgi:hypothetical protein